MDAIISPNNALARTFWKENFSSHVRNLKKTKGGPFNLTLIQNEVHETVGWKKFITSFVKFCGIDFNNGKPLDDQLEVKALKLILGMYSLPSLFSFCFFSFWYSYSYDMQLKPEMTWSPSRSSLRLWSGLVLSPRIRLLLTK